MERKSTRMILVLAASLLVLLGTINTALAWTLSGTIYGGSAKLPNATIELVNAVSSAQEATTSTDAAGGYTFTVGNGSYNLVITPPSGSGFTQSVVNGVVINNADVVQNAVLVSAAVTMSGSVYMPDGTTPINGVYVYVQDAATGVTAWSGQTSTAGEFSAALAAGTYNVSMQAYDSNTTPLTPGYFSLTAFSNVSVSSSTTLSKTVIPIVVLSGKTVNGSGTAVGSVSVAQEGMYVGNYYLQGSTTSDTSGNYSIAVISGSGYNFTLTPPSASGLSRSRVTGVSVTSDTTRDLALSAGVTVSGSVYMSDGTTPVNGVYVYFYDSSTGSNVWSGTTSNSGAFEAHVPQGTYNIYMGAYDSYTTPKTPYYVGWYAFSNQVVSADTVLSSTVLPVVTLSGRTTDSSGIAVAGVAVRLNSISVNGYYLSANTVTSDSNGNYSIDLVAGSGYSFTLTPPTSSSGLGLTTVTGINVTADTTRDLALSAGITLSGTLVMSDGTTPVDGAYVTLYNASGGSYVWQGRTNAQGGFSSASVPAGSYNLYMQVYDSSTTPFTPANMSWYQFTNNAYTSSTNIGTVVLPAFVVLSGKTTNSIGAPVAGVSVQQEYITLGGYSLSSNTVTSDSEGNFRFALISGTGYNFTIRPPAGSGFAQTRVLGLSAVMDSNLSIILSMPDTKAPDIISGPGVSAKTDTTATIEWHTDEPTKGNLVYGTTDPPGNTVAESAFVSTHSMQLSGLRANTKYYVKVTATDSADNGPTTSSTINFMTDPIPDRVPPVIMTGPNVSGVTQNSAVVEWTTDEPTTGEVNYGLSSLPNLTVADTTSTTTHRVTVTGLTPGNTYYLQVKATDAANNPTVLSAVINFPTLPAPDTVAPHLDEGPMAIDITDTSATVVWLTDEPATSGVSYFDGTAYGVLPNATLTTNHSVKITGLTPSKEYSFIVSSEDALGNGPTLSVSRSFKTKALVDSNAPVFDQLPIVKEVTHQSAVIYWTTDEPATAAIQYGTTEALGSSDAAPQLNTKHNRTLTGLLPGTTYYFRVQSADSLNNVSTSSIYTLTTGTTPRTTPPVITGAPAIVYSTDKAATVAFTTDRSCDTVVNYGPVGGVGYQRSNSEKTTEHQMSLNNLEPNTSYDVRVSCTDISGNTVTASAGTPSTFMAMNYSFILSDAFVGASGVGFLTKSQPDTTAPTITTTPRAIAVNPTMVRIHWNTSEISDSQVFFGLSGQSLSSSAGDIGKAAGHSIALTNLTPGTTYQFQVKSSDPSNNSVVSGVYSFTTDAVADSTPPVISATSATAAGSDRIEVSWASDELATTVLKFGTSLSNLTGQTSVAGARTSHSVSLYNLVPGTTYYVAPVSTDGTGNSTHGATKSVTLPGAAPVSYTITGSGGVGGTITPASQSVYSGYRHALAVKPDLGYQIQSVSGCGGTLSGNVYTTSEVTGNCQVSAIFAVDPNWTGVTLTTVAYPNGGTYSGGTLMVKLAANMAGSSIYYTVDGTTPTLTSKVYSERIPVSGTTTLKFFAKTASATEAVKSVTYTAIAAGQPGASFVSKSGTTFTVTRSGAGGSATVYSGNQTSFADTGTLQPNTIYTYTVQSNAEGNTDLLALRTPLYHGWNIVAVPHDTTGVTPSTLFGGAVNAVYRWEPSGATPESSNSVLGSYSTVTSLLPGYGYFVKPGNGATTLAYNGSSGPQSANVTLNPGWTMIANPNTIVKSDIASNWLIDGSALGIAVLADKIGGGIYWWNGTTYDSWSIVSGNPQVEPWKGYWMLNLDSVPHTLTIQ